MSNQNSKLVDIECNSIFETPACYCVTIEDDTFGKEAERIWLPKSQVEREDDVYTMPEWLAIEKGLV